MQIFYCDQCGKRIPQAQIDNGQAASLGDEKLACPDCARHAAPRAAPRPQAKSSGIRLEAIQSVQNPASSGTLVPYRRPARDAGAGHDRHDKLGGHGHGAKGADPSSSGKLYAGVGIGFFVVLLGVIFASGGTKKIEGDRRNTADSPRAKTDDAPVQAKGPQMLTPQGTRTPPEPRHTPRTVPESVPGPAVLPAPLDPAEEREDLAADAFNVLKKFEGLAETDKDGRKKKIESFLATYGDTMAGARARVLLQKLESGDLAEDPDEPAEPVETAGEQTAPVQSIQESVAEDGSRIVTVLLSKLGAGGTVSEAGTVKSSGLYLNIGNSDMKTTTFLRFPELPVPPKARILEAHIQFTTKYPEKPSVAEGPPLMVEAEAADESLPIDKLPIGKRARTQAQVLWSAPPWTATGEQGPDQRTPNLSAVVQEVVDQPGWRKSNPVLFLFSKGRRHSAFAQERKKPTRSPTLTVRYRKGGSGAPTPTETVDASKPSPAAADASLPLVLAVLAPELRSGAFEDAADHVEVLLKDPNFAGAAEVLAREKRDLAAVLALREAAIASLNEGGKTVKLNKGKLDLEGKTVRGTDKGKVTVRVAGGLEMVVYAREFSAEEIDRYAPPSKSAEDRRARAYLHLATGNAAQAKAILVEAGKNGDPDLQPYLDRLDLAALDANSLKAKAAWLGVEKRVEEKQFPEAEAELKAFRATYGDTAFAKGIAAAVEVRAQEIYRVLNPYLPGLKGEYFKSSNLKADERQKDRVDAKIDFRWEGAAPMSGVSENFAVRWTGYLKAPKQGTYTVALSIDDGGRLWIDNKLVVDAWRSGVEKKHTGVIDLDEGYHALKVDYFDGSGTATCVFSWSLKDDFAEQVVPAEALWHRGETKPEGNQATNDAPATELKPTTLAPEDGTYLAAIKPKSVSIGGGQYAADGTLGFSAGKISVGGVESPHGICTHPFENSTCHVEYEMEKAYRHFVGHAAINDTGDPKVPLIFTVEVDGNLVWTSRPMQAKGEFEAFAIDVTRGKTLVLKVHCKGSNDNAVAVWFEPRLLLVPLASATSGNPPVQVFLSDLQEVNATVVPGWFFGKKGKMGNSNYKNDPISANGVLSPNGINMTPPERDKAVATYALDRKYTVFESRVAICDTSKDRAKAPAIFKVYADDRLLWQSQPIHLTKVIEDCKVDVRNVSKLTLEVECPKVNLYLHAVWLEPRLLATSAAAGTNPAPAADPTQVYLSDLLEQDVSVVANWKFGRKGQTGAPAGDKNAKILVAGFESPNGLGMHPPSNGKAHAAYKLGKKYRTFRARVALNDSSANQASSPVVYKVLADGKVVWQSNSIQKLKVIENCQVDVSGVEKLELEVECKGDAGHCHAVWIEPLLSR